MTNETFTIDGTTFTVGEKWKHCSEPHCPNEVEIVGWTTGSKTRVAVRFENGRVGNYAAANLGPIPEPTIEVPVALLKRMRRVLCSEDDGVGLLTAIGLLLDEAGH